MIIGSKTLSIDFDTIPIDEYWTSGDVIESKLHRIHAYPAKFPAFITTKALKFARDRSLEVKIVADIFCGCGTTAYEAKRNGIDFWGCDINPVATLIAKTKSATYDNRKLNKYFNTILRHLDDLKTVANHFHQNERINYWYSVENIVELSKLKECIDRELPNATKYRNFFLCAFSNILKPTSKWLTKSIKPQFDPNKIPGSVRHCFISQFQLMLKAVSETVVYTNSRVKIENVNVLNKKFASSFADLIITSPPYVTSYEYADLHQLSTLWLDYTQDYKQLREGTIGSLYHNSNFEKNLENLSEVGKNVVQELRQKDPTKSKAVAKYFVDMQKCIVQAKKILNPKGLALFVIGNTEYMGVKINNAKHLVENLLLNGFTDIDVTRRKISKKILTPYRDEKGKFSNDLASRKVYSEEFIVIAQKCL